MTSIQSSHETITRKNALTRPPCFSDYDNYRMKTFYDFSAPLASPDELNSLIKSTML